MRLSIQSLQHRPRLVGERIKLAIERTLRRILGLPKVEELYRPETFRDLRGHRRGHISGAGPARTARCRMA